MSKSLFDVETAYHITDQPGVPFGVIGSGSFCFSNYGFTRTDGLHNALDRGAWDWRREEKGARPGTFIAVCEESEDSRTVRLLQSHHPREGGARGYQGLEPVQEMEGRALLPRCDYAFRDPALQSDIKLTIFTPLIPHDYEASCTPAALFAFEIHNPADRDMRLSLLFSMQNDTGWRSDDRWTRDGSRTIVREEGGHIGLFGTYEGREVKSVLEHLGDFTLITERRPDMETAVHAGWNVLDDEPVPLRQFVHTGFIDNVEDARTACEGERITAGSVAVRMNLSPNESKQVVFAYAWYYPYFRTPSPYAADLYEHRYAGCYADSGNVADHAMQMRLEWETRIAEWHSSIADRGLPPELPRYWFSSLASVVTSTLWSKEHFFEVEVPHEWVSTMDVCAYSSWAYLMFWPEIERREMDQYLSTAPEQGMVYHSLWNEWGGDARTGYFEEPVFVCRVYRDYLWFQDLDWLRRMWPMVRKAIDFVYDNFGRDYLIGSPGGNQSYDEWKMPGINAYINAQWLVALQFAGRMQKLLGERGGTSAGTYEEHLDKARESFFKHLDYVSEDGDEYFKLFSRVDTDRAAPDADACFVEQLFGLWMGDITQHDVLPEEKVSRVLQSIYKLNRMEDKEIGVVAWVNGILPGGRQDNAGIFSATSWTAPPWTVGAMLWKRGMIAEAKEMISATCRSLQPSLFAVGEWDRTLTNDHRWIRTRPYLYKDSPSFPPYPRYKVSWNYLFTILGLSLKPGELCITPRRGYEFSVKEIRIAGHSLSYDARSGAGPVVIEVDGQKYEAAYDSTLVVKL